MKTLQMERLTRAAFAPFGELIELDGARHFPINGGTTERYHDLANVDVTENGGRPLINLFRAQPRALPIEITMMERHSLGSQAFIPLTARRYLVVVAPPGECDPARMRAFWSDGWQGVNYAKGVWHHPLLALDQVSDFVVVDRGGEQPDCDELSLAEPSRGGSNSKRASSWRKTPKSPRSGNTPHASLFGQLDQLARARDARHRSARSRTDASASRLASPRGSVAHKKTRPIFVDRVFCSPPNRAPRRGR